MQIYNLKKLEKYRAEKGFWKSNEGDNFGLFFVPFVPGKSPLKVLCAPMDSEWQHVSVSLPKRCPTWDEMCFIKELFWGPDKTVIQYHPPKSEYVNNCKTCLHLWRKKGEDFERPPTELVGIKLGI